MDPVALSALIEGAKIIFAARGGEKGPVEAEAPTIAFAFASVVAIEDIAPGQVLNENNIWLKRPGGGDFSVLDYEGLLGKTVKSPVSRGFQLKKSDFI
jgi:N-acetylneuraminate synthase